jgi:3'(2'), 5'-bisphosphate nucleotidase
MTHDAHTLPSPQAPLFPEGEADQDAWTPITTSPLTDVRQARFCESVEAAHSAQGEAAELAQLLGITRPSVRMDSQCKYGILARGEVHLYLRLPLPAAQQASGRTYVECIWDHAAGSVLVEEAGGRVTDMHGAPLDFTQGRKLLRNQGVIATSAGVLHDQVLAAIRRLRSDPPV